MNQPHTDAFRDPVKGIIPATKAITLNTGASANSRLLAQTAVALVQNTVTQP
jgi:hypothetical protein